MLPYFYVNAAVTITVASGGESLCSGSYTTLGNITISENNNADLSKQTDAKLVISAPSGYEFKAGSGSYYFESAKNISAMAINVTTSSITITYTTDNTNKLDFFYISGIQVKASNVSPVAASGNMIKTLGSPTDASIVGMTNGSTSFGTLTQAAAMAYSSSAVTQNNTANVDVGTSNNDIIGIQVVVSGACGTGPTATSFALSTTGSTDAANDISSAKIYYTGSTSTFSASNLFGTQASPNGSFTINGSQTLVTGTNYFWLAYNVSGFAKTTNILDAECTSVTVGGSSYTPSPSTISGSRTIGIGTITSNGTGGGNWSSGSSWTGGVAPSSANHVTILNGDAITLTADASCIDLNINGGATGGSLNLSSFQLTISGNLTVTSPGTLTTTCNSKLVVVDYGSKSQITLPSSVTMLQKITLNRTAGVTCNHNLNLSTCVPGDSVVIVLTKGVLSMTSGAKLLLNSIAIKLDINTTDNSYVDGIVSRTVATGGKMYIFPVGNSGKSRRFGIAQHSGADGVHDVQFIYASPVNYNYINYGFLPGGIIDKYYWKHVNVSGGNPQRRIYYKDSDFPELSSAQRIAYLTLANNKVSTSTDEWTKPTTGWMVDDTYKYCQFTGANASNNEYWTFGSTNATAILPVSIIYFNASTSDNEVKLSWATASEINNDYFTVEKSIDGVNFESLTNIDGSGNSNSIISYNASDDNPYNGISYYRLKQTDFDGRYSYSDVIFVNNSKENNILVYPNPVNDIINISLPENYDIINIEAYNALGIKVFSKTIESKNFYNNIFSINVKETLKNGVYLFNITTNNKSNIFRIVVNNN